MKEKPSPNHKLRAARLTRSWTLAVAAEHANVSLEAYARWEYGTQRPRLSSLQLLCQGFGKTAEELGYEDLTSLAPAEENTDLEELEATASQEASLPETDELDASPLIRLTPEEVATLLPLIEGMTMDEAKRMTLHKLMTIMKVTAVAPLAFADPEPMERLTRASSTPAAMNTESFQHFESLLEGCWGLNNDGDMNMASAILSRFLPRMTQIATDVPQAAAIAAQGLRLQSLLRAHQLRIDEMVPLCKQSVDYARTTNDPNILSAALNGLAVAYKYAQQPEASFRAYQEALYYNDQASPLLRSRVYAGAASAFAQRGRLKEADFYIHLAYEDFPADPERDPNFLTADNGLYMLSYYEGLIYLQQGLPNEAIQAFERYKSLLPGQTIPERNRLEIVNHQGRAALLAGDLEHYTLLLQEGIAGARRLGSRKRYDEAIQFLRTDLPRTWRQEPQIRQIVEQFSLPVGEMQ